MTFQELEVAVHDEIIGEHEDPAIIAVKVALLLEGLSRKDAFLVRRLAADIAAGIATERAYNDGDMVAVIRVLAAVRDPALAWLKRQDVDGTMG